MKVKAFVGMLLSIFKKGSCRSHVLYIDMCLDVVLPHSLGGCMVKAETGQKIFNFMLIITNVAHQKEANSF